MTYGPLIGHIGDAPFHDFPEPEALLGAEVESQLRNLGFGYRAKYIAKTAQIVAGKPHGWLNALRSPDSPAFPSATNKELAKGGSSKTYKEAHKELLELSGVGPKVADCVCLMGLGWSEAVPIDTHVWQIAQRDYKFGKGKAKTFSLSLYDTVGDFFRDIWGKEAGWAHSVLFTADLRAFSDRTAQKAETAIIKVKKEESVDDSGETLAVIPKKRRRVSAMDISSHDIKDVSVITTDVHGDGDTKLSVRRSTRIRTTKLEGP